MYVISSFRLSLFISIPILLILPLVGLPTRPYRDERGVAILNSEFKGDRRLNFVKNVIEIRHLPEREASKRPGLFWYRSDDKKDWCYEELYTNTLFHRLNHSDENIRIKAHMRVSTER
jgi:hypothetical protein